MGISRDGLALRIEQMLGAATSVDASEFTAVEQRLLDCVIVLGRELTARIRAGPLRRIAIEHDLHKLSDLPLLQQVSPDLRQQIVSRMEDPRHDPQNECKLSQGVPS